MSRNSYLSCPPALNTTSLKSQRGNIDSHQLDDSCICVESISIDTQISDYQNIMDIRNLLKEELLVNGDDMIVKKYTEMTNVLKKINNALYTFTIGKPLRVAHLILNKFHKEEIAVTVSDWTADVLDTNTEDMKIDGICTGYNLGYNIYVTRNRLVDAFVLLMCGNEDGIDTHRSVIDNNSIYNLDDDELCLTYESKYNISNTHNLTEFNKMCTVIQKKGKCRSTNAYKQQSIKDRKKVIGIHFNRLVRNYTKTHLSSVIGLFKKYQDRYILVMTKAGLVECKMEGNIAHFSVPKSENITLLDILDNYRYKKRVVSEIRDASGNALPEYAKLNRLNNAAYMACNEDNNIANDLLTCYFNMINKCHDYIDSIDMQLITGVSMPQVVCDIIMDYSRKQSIMWEKNAHLANVTRESIDGLSRWLNTLIKNMHSKRQPREDDLIGVLDKITEESYLLKRNLVWLARDEDDICSDSSDSSSY